MSKQTDFINRIAPYAVAAQRETGIPASTTIAQAILETGWGESVPEGSHNYFGIKAGLTWKGKTVSFITHEEHADGVWRKQKDTFRAYESDEEAFIDHGAIFYNGLYEDALPYRSNPVEFTRRMAKRYATDSQYANKLLSIMQRYDLYQYDLPPSEWRVDTRIVPPKWSRWSPTKPVEAPVVAAQEPAKEAGILHVNAAILTASTVTAVGATSAFLPEPLSGEVVIWGIILMIVGALMGVVVNPERIREAMQARPGKQMEKPDAPAPVSPTTGEKASASKPRQPRFGDM